MNPQTQFELPKQQISPFPNHESYEGMSSDCLYEAALLVIPETIRALDMRLKKHPVTFQYH
jgi:hypothetical protein